MSSAQQYRTGYAIERENIEQLTDEGQPMAMMLQAAREASVPPINPHARLLDVLAIRNQGNVGACQGFALAVLTEICLFLLTSRIYRLSAMAAYIWSQVEDGLIREGDVGSTLSGGNRTIRKGICLESVWPYTGRYSSTIPAGAESQRLFNLISSKPIETVEQAKEWNDSGWPIQTGIGWPMDQMDRPIVNDYRPSSRDGGHSTLVWGKDRATGFPRNYNSWGQWQDQGTQLWSWNALDQMIKWRGPRGERNVFIAYRPDFNQQYPTPDPVVTNG